MSVVIATWNAEATIQRCLQSVREQTLPLEVIVVDGRSRDRTSQIVRSYRDIVRHWISEADRGLYDALNKGARLARGEYVYILGSDDRLATPDALTRLLDGAQCADVVYGDAVIEDRRGRPHVSRALPLGRFRYQMPFSHQAALVKRELLVANPFAGSLASDYRQLFALYLQGARFQYVHTVVAVYALGGISDRCAVASTWDRLRINVSLRGWRALDVLPFYVAQVGVCWLKPRLLRALRRHLD